ncbi:hypothetical protein FHS29_003396 [Saccharothrix tamanrassetensis]|uniref:Uncharacterized protein n=1 Tax=Saccharothrix tamanrassetensis TaxID=1051531 RepID=A0A841CIJ7_9PSEU|nr:hypothetical protein [Saccharothrix tamanrassetensis]MBB5956803.1 hypothetical protein [Saccharothrix tamanrassetensis]
MTGREREPTLDEFIEEPEAKLDLLGEVDGTRDVVDTEADPDEEYEHVPVDEV